MNAWIKRIGLVVLVVVLAVGVAGTAMAQGPRGGQPRQGVGDYLRWRFDAPQERALRAILTALRDATGLTWDDVAGDVREGMTLSAILTENGMDPDAVAQDVVADLTAAIEQAVDDGSIAQERADTLIANLPDAVDRVMNTSLPATAIRDRAAGRIVGHVEHSLVGVLAEMAGVDTAELLRDALTPPTLAEIAQAQGLDPEAIIAEAATRITEEVNAAVAAGELTEDQAAQMLDGLAERLETRMDAPLRQFANPRDRMPGPGRFGPLGPSSEPGGETEDTTAA